MATLIKEQLRNPVDNSWIPLREVEGDKDGSVTAIKYLNVKGNPIDHTTEEPGVFFPDIYDPDNPVERQKVLYPVGFKDGEITPIETSYIFDEGEAVEVSFPLSLISGKFEKENPLVALKKLDLSAKENNLFFSWDGNTNEKERLNDYFFKVSDEYIPIDSFKEIRISRIYGDGAIQSITLNLSSINQIADGYYSISFPAEDPEAWDMPLACYIIDGNQAEKEGISAGIYFARREDTGGELIYYVSSLDFTGYNVVNIASGGTGAATPAQALNNLGITWGTSAAPNKGTPNTIYIQLLSAEG